MWIPSYFFFILPILILLWIVQVSCWTYRQWIGQQNHALEIRLPSYALINITVCHGQENHKQKKNAHFCQVLCYAWLKVRLCTCIYFDAHGSLDLEGILQGVNLNVAFVSHKMFYIYVKMEVGVWKKLYILLCLRKFCWVSLDSIYNAEM